MPLASTACEYGPTALGAWGEAMIFSCYRVFCNLLSMLCGAWRSHGACRMEQRYEKILFGVLVCQATVSRRGNISRRSSPTHSTADVAAKTIPQSAALRGTTLNIVPPKVTIRYCRRV